MAPPPEVLFHRYFLDPSIPQVEPGRIVSDLRPYKGKLDLDSLDDVNVRLLLAGIQESFNGSLRNEKKDVPEHVDHPEFHFDYIDSVAPNALAFRHECYSFIGVTIALVRLCWDVCVRLSRSAEISTLIGLSLPDGDDDRFHVVLFRTLLNFAVAHEYTHHVHGHVTARESKFAFFDEILVDGADGRLEAQALEADADGYAAYHVLANLIDGGERQAALNLLNLLGDERRVQDEVLLSCFVVSVGAYLFVRPATALDVAIVYTLDHPPQAARMDLLMRQAIAWCVQNRPELEQWMTVRRFQRLMQGVAQATAGINGGRDWVQQTAFLRSEEGSDYFRQLNERIKAHVASLGRAAAPEPNRVATSY